MTKQINKKPFTLSGWFFLFSCTKKYPLVGIVLFLDPTYFRRKIGMNKIELTLLILVLLTLASCQKEYTCVCTDTRNGEKISIDKVKTTKLGKKGFEDSCKSNSTDLQECYID